MRRSAAKKIEPVIIDLNGTNEQGQPTYAGYTTEQAMRIACESSSREALTWLKAWWNAELTTYNTTPENF
ncbi:hypothetical protein EV128_12598 [Rhizobium azibense]|nr:hypothetical protein EV128_12598 [Rhizobium azibense]